MTSSDTLVPTEGSPVLRLLGDCASAAIGLIRFEPMMTQQLALAPRRALHATAVYIGSPAAAGLSTAELAAKLLARHPRNLLREAIPDCDRRLYHLLDHASIPAWNYECYRQLEHLLRADLFPISPGKSEITPVRVEGLHKCLDEHPARAAWLIPLSDPDDRAAAQALLAFFEAASLLGSRELPVGMDDIAVARAVLWTLSRAEAPVAAFPVPAGWRQLRLIRDAFAVGRRLGNCLQGHSSGMIEHVLGALTGRLVLLHHAEQNILAEVVAEPNGLWSLGSARGRKNAPAPEQLVEELLASLREGGFRLLPFGLNDALHRVLGPLHHRPIWFGPRPPAPATAVEEESLAI